MMVFSINGIDLEVEINNAKMAEFGIPSWIPSAAVDRIDKRNVVFITTAFSELDENTQRILLSHEAGHVACDHLELPEAQTGDLVINARLEAEADAWAARTWHSELFDGAMDAIAYKTIDELMKNHPDSNLDEIRLSIFC